jgi:hypothetical protein
MLVYDSQCGETSDERTSAMPDRLNPTHFSRSTPSLASLFTKHTGQSSAALSGSTSAIAVEYRG